jgi:hypothetical protein
MKHRISALFLGTALALAAGGGAMAQYKNIKIGVLTDNSGPPKILSSLLLVLRPSQK